MATTFDSSGLAAVFSKPFQHVKHFGGNHGLRYLDNLNGRHRRIMVSSPFGPLFGDDLHDFEYLFIKLSHRRSFRLGLILDYSSRPL